MRIDNSLIAMEGRHSVVERHQMQETLRVWVDPEQPAENTPRKSTIDTVQLSEKAKSTYNATEPELTEAETGHDNSLRTLLVESLVEMVTGVRVKITTPQLSRDAGEAGSVTVYEKTSDANAHLPQKEGWGVVYDYHESHYEREDMAFEANGVIRTKDGKEINFRLQFTMSREFMEQNNITFRTGDAKKIDPLVINFDGNAARLTDEKFNFDLNADGKKDNISFVKPGSGFLALDHNHDGIINDGRELFGPQSGNGFADLAKYDEDGNHWIDEQDSVFGKLRVWSKDGQGTDVLSTLASRNIGAIYLGQAWGTFDIRSASNVSLGEVKSTGVYLKENGSAGTVQQLDLAA